MRRTTLKEEVRRGGARGGVAEAGKGGEARKRSGLGRAARGRRRDAPTPTTTTTTTTKRIGGGG
jgi:hypothetical protein